VDARRLTALAGVGRIVLGGAIILAPRTVTGRWLGPDAREPLVVDLARGMAARDIALGVASLLTLGTPRTAARLQLACAGVDATDAAATYIARRELPARGAAATIALAGASSVVSVALAAGLGREAG
jgi:hypothetical protein